MFKEGPTNYRAHKLVAIFIHDTILYQKLILNTPLQAIAARFNIWRDVTIVSIYNSRIHSICESILSTLFRQLPKPVTLTRSLNSYHKICWSSANDNRGCQVLFFINKNQLHILNHGRQTRTSITSKLSIVLTIAPPSLQPILSWIVTHSPLCTDHCVITLNIQSEKSEPRITITKLNINKASCELISSNEAWMKVTIPNRSQLAEPLTED